MWRTFTVRGVPQPQPRHRFAGHAYLPKDHPIHEWKRLVRYSAEPTRPAVPITGAVRILMIVNLPRPKGLYRKKDPVGAIEAPVQPDNDNYEKAVWDALTVDKLTGIGWWKNDGQITDNRTVKRYHCRGGWPGAVITVWWKD